jgi:hypothetical protein
MSRFLNTLKHSHPIFFWYTNSRLRLERKNDPSYEFIGEVILKINIVYAEKIKAEVYINQDKSLSDLQTLILNIHFNIWIFFMNY